MSSAGTWSRTAQVPAPCAHPGNGVNPAHGKVLQWNRDISWERGGDGTYDCRDDDTGHAQDDELAHRIEGTELHEDGGDHVVCAGNIRGIFQVPLCDLWLIVTADQQPHTEEGDQPHDYRQGCSELCAVFAFAQVQARLVTDDQHHDDHNAELHQ